MIALGIAAWASAQEAESDAPGIDTMRLVFVSRMIFVMGCATAGLAVLALFGKMKKIRQILQMYAIGIFVVCIIQLAMGIWLYTVEVTDEIMENVEREGSGAYLEYQKWGKCCYWQEFPDWGVNCHIDDKIPPFCKDATVSWLESTMYPLAAVTIAGSCLQLIACVCTVIWVFGQAKEKVDITEDAFHY